MSKLRLSTDRRLAYIPYYRNNILYLHLAEALNQAGFPETAYAILAYGLTYDVMNNRKLISQDEFDRLCEIRSYGFSLSDSKYNSDAELGGKTSSTFVIWPSSVFENIDHSNPKSLGFYPTTITITDGNTTRTKYQYGIHSFGSGDSEYNKHNKLDTDEITAGLLPDVEEPVYQILPRLNSRSTHEDSVAYQEIVEANEALRVQYEADQAAVNAANAAYLASAPVRAARQSRVCQMVLEEEALEGMFEGNRFYDLLRYQMQDGKVGGTSSTITMPAHITEKYGVTTKMEGKPWYLPLPTR